VKLSRVAVQDDWTGEGVGGALLDHVEAAAREEGHDVVWLTTPPGHPFLPDLYRGRGYEVTDEYPLSYRDYDEVVVEKPLG
jgi:GNAT superfamily N-acetyltransferase